MYYNYFTRRVVFDLVDVYLLTFLITVYATKCLKFYFSEEEQMKRLREDLIKQSNLIESFSKPKVSSSEKQMMKIYNFAVRGGDLDSTKTTRMRLLSAAADRISRIVIYVLSLSKTQVANGNLIFRFISSHLEYIMARWGITAIYCTLSLGTPFQQETIIAIVLGGTTGAIVGWIGVGVTLMAEVLIGAIVSRSLAQQLINWHEFYYIREHALRLMKDEKFQNEFYARMQRILNKEPKLAPLNWEINPALQETAEKLGLTKPDALGPTRPFRNILRDMLNSNREKIGKIEKRMKTLKDLYDKLYSDSEILDVNFVDESKSNIPITIFRYYRR